VTEDDCKSKPDGYVDLSQVLYKTVVISSRNQWR
jgi:hypothetical protein